MIITRKEILGEKHQEFGINTSEMETVNLDSTDVLQKFKSVSVCACALAYFWGEG